MRYFFTTFLLLLVTSSGLAEGQRYQQTHFEITNKTNHIETLLVSKVIGHWQIPVADGSSFTLLPNMTYKNTLISVKQQRGFENFVSFTVSRKESPREHYLIFGESTQSWEAYAEAHIFDGLGPMFVKSETNHCDEMGVDGNPVCTLMVRDQ